MPLFNFFRNTDMLRFSSILYPLFFLGVSLNIFCQSLPSNQLIFENYFRRSQLNGLGDSSSFFLRPIRILDSISISSSKFEYGLKIFSNNSSKKISSELIILPLNTAFQMSTGNPYPEGGKFIQARGYQHWSSVGVYGSFGPFSLQIQPEFIFAKNKSYDWGFPKEGKIEYVEFFGNGSYSKFLPGQSSLRINQGAFSLGVSTENIWWGPGQYNSLLFSNNAFGFPHFTLNTRKPARTFFGSFEGQLLVGKLQNFVPFVRDGRDDWRYLNGFTFSYQPKWIPGLYFGASRVFQQYSSFNDRSFSYYFPLFEPFQKYKLIDSNSPIFNSSTYDDKLQSQQLTGFFRFLIPKARGELYFEYGRRDHAVNWREFILNPEHARAYLFGFKKLVPLPNESFFEINGEILQQQESINILTRYGPIGGSSWASHDIIQGFTHQGQMLGPGIGPSSNSQTLETSWIKGIKKIGVRWERLNRHQDVFTKFFYDSSNQKPWVDYSARLLIDWEWRNFLISSNVNFVYSLNQQWNIADANTAEFNSGKNEFAITSQIHLIYSLSNLKR